MLRMLAVEEKMEKGLFRKDKANTDFSLDSCMHLVCTLSKMTPPRKSVKSPCFPKMDAFGGWRKRGRSCTAGSFIHCGSEKIVLGRK